MEKNKLILKVAKKLSEKDYSGIPISISLRELARMEGEKDTIDFCNWVVRPVGPVERLRIICARYKAKLEVHGSTTVTISRIKS